MKTALTAVFFSWATTTMALTPKSTNHPIYPHIDIATNPTPIRTVLNEQNGDDNGLEPYHFMSQTTDTLEPIDTSPVLGTSENALEGRALGLNCRGSGRCPFCTGHIDELLEALSGINDTITYRNHDKIVCRTCSEYCPDCDEPHQGFCVFPQKMRKNERVSAKVVKEKVRRLKRHGCKRCGSCPIHPGNNVKTGEVTINFVFAGCGDGVCKPHNWVLNNYWKWYGSNAETVAVS